MWLSRRIYSHADNLSRIVDSSRFLKRPTGDYRNREGIQVRHRAICIHEGMSIAVLTYNDTVIIDSICGTDTQILH